MYQHILYYDGWLYTTCTCIISSGIWLYPSTKYNVNIRSRSLILASELIFLIYMEEKTMGNRFLLFKGLWKCCILLFFAATLCNPDQQKWKKGRVSFHLVQNKYLKHIGPMIIHKIFKSISIHISIYVYTCIPNIYQSGYC